MIRFFNSFRACSLKVIAATALCCVSTWGGASRAAEPLVLTLEESIAIAMDKDLGYKKILNSEKATEYGFLAAKAAYRPQINLSALSPNRTEETREQFDFQTQLYQWVRTGTSFYKGEISVSQMLPTDGIISVGSYLHRRNQYNTFSGETKRSEEYQAWGQIRFWQPLFQQSSQKLNREKSEISWSRAKQGLRRGESDLIYDVTGAFLNLFAAEKNLQILQEQEKLSSNAYEIAVAKRDAGVVDEIEVLRTQSEMATNRGNVLGGEAELQTQSLQFKKLLRIDINQPVTLQEPGDIAVSSVELEEALRLARENNAEIRQAELDCELGRLDLWDAKRAGGLSADLYLYYNLTGTDTLFSRSYKDPNRNTQFMFRFSLPIYDSGQKRARISRSKIDLGNNEVTLAETTERIEQEVRLAVTNLEDSRSRIEQARIGLQYNQKFHEQSLIKYKIGQIPTYQLLEAQVRLAQARKRELDTRISQRIALARLEQLTQTRWN